MNVAIITAAGSGKRLPGQVKKQFIPIAGKPLLFHTLDVFLNHPDIHRIIVTLPQEDLEQGTSMISHEYHTDRIKCIPGGQERQHSVFNALQECGSDTEYVLVHDGVRPFVNHEEITGLLSLAYEKKAVIPVSPVNHTLKKVLDGKVVSTVSRTDLYQVYTPQVFEYHLLLDSYMKTENAGQIFTDDASILEYLQIPVHTLTVSPWNIKVTEPEDVRIAELIILKGDK